MEINQKDTPNIEHADYMKNTSARKRIADLLSGTDALRKGGEMYLPMFPEELDTDYKARKKLATLLNLYKKNENLMCGLVFKNEIELGSDVDAQIVKLAENIDKKGNHLNVFAETAFKESFFGCSVIQIDAPVWSADIQSLEDVRMLDLSPYWILWKAENVINWNERINPVSKRTELDLIVFKETKAERSGMFLRELMTFYRVLYLDEMNRAAWQLWKEVKNDKGEIECVPIDGGLITVRNGNTEKTLSKLPVSVVGELGAPPPMLDLADINIKHYQKEAGFDNLEFQAAVPLFYTKGYKRKTPEEYLPVGANIHYELPENGDIGWAQLDASGFESLRTTLHDLTDQMSQIGLSMLVDKTTRADITATQAIIDNVAETSELRTKATQLKDALELALGITAIYLGLEETRGGSIELGAAWNQDAPDMMPEE